jgi:hypothetical protein
MVILGSFSGKGSKLVMMKRQWCKTKEKLKVKTCRERGKEGKKRERERNRDQKIPFSLFRNLITADQ